MPKISIWSYVQIKTKLIKCFFLSVCNKADNVSKSEAVKVKNIETILLIKTRF